MRKKKERGREGVTGWRRCRLAVVVVETGGEGGEMVGGVLERNRGE